MFEAPLYVLAALGFHIALSEFLARRTFFRHVGSALLVIVLTAVSANLGLLPTYEGKKELYDTIFGPVAALAIFLLLLGVNLSDLRKAGGALVGLFLLGSFGTVAGVFCGLLAAGGLDAFGELTFALGGMFVGTYTGGSVNFNAVAAQYGVLQDGGLYLGASVVDSSMTTIWMVATVAIPRLLSRVSRRETSVAPSGVADAPGGAARDSETTNHLDLALLGGIGLLCVWVSDELAAKAREVAHVEVPSVLLLSTFALVLAQVRFIQALRGARLLGMLLVMLFLSVIGVLCDIGALASLGDLAGRLTVFCSVCVLVHGVIVFGVGTLLGQDPVLAAVASQANIGGGTSALALARSLGRPDLVLPALVIGALGNAIGTYLGFGVAELLR